MAVDQPPVPPAAEVPEPPADSQRRIGRYLIQRELGRGGMGAVYLAVNEESGERVALKELLLTAAADPVSVQRFLQEGEVMSRLTHANIVGVREIVDTGQGHYIALEYIEGTSLRDLLKSGPLPTPQAFAVMDGLLKALDYAHQHAIVHRDVKPENVMISSTGEVKVADFGIARLTDDSATSHATKTGTTVGTPQYMSPEQVTTSKVDGRSDLYSAGIVCYEVFCGKPPFEATEADGPFTLFAKHVQAPPPPPSVRRPGLDLKLEEVILKSLAKRPEERYQTGAEFARALAPIGTRLCGPNWPRSLEPGADLAAMVPESPSTMATMAMPAMGATMVMPTSPTSPSAPGMATMAMPAGAPPLPTGYAPKPPTRQARGVAARDTKPGAGPNWLVIGGIAAVVIVVIGAVAGYLVFAGKPASTRQPAAIASNPPAQQACDWLKTGVTPSQGAAGSCGLTLGSPVQSDSFAGQSSLPKDLLPSPATIPVGGGFAALSAGSKGSGASLITASPAPADVIALADFTPTSSGDADIGLTLRESAGVAGIAVNVSPKGKVSILEGTGGASTITERYSDNANVLVNQPNRLVVQVKGSQVTAYFNGQLVSTVQTVIAGGGQVAFHDLDQGTAPSTVNLSALYIFAAG